MDMRRAKQWIYGTFYGIVLTLIFTGLYFLFFRTAPSCFDNIQNQGETGVDCGGPCEKVCIPSNLQHISVLGNVQTFTASQGHVTILGQIANTNADFAGRSFDYTFNLYDASDNIIQAIQGRSFIYAGEVKYLVAPNVSVVGSMNRVTLAIRNVDWAAASALGIVPQFGSSPSIVGSGVSSSTVTVNGELRNRDFAAFTDILIVAVFKSVEGTPIGASQTKVDSIAPNETKDFSVLYPAVPGLDPSLTQFYAYAFRQ